jgi:hypothetical protein
VRQALTKEAEMCGYKRELRAAGADYPADGETVRLTDLAQGGGRRCSPGFPWWTLWLLWPLFWLAKGALHMVAPVVAWLSQPVLLAISPLPIILIAAGLVVLALGALRRSHE